MKPKRFEESNLTLTAPPGDEDRVQDLPAWTDGGQCVSCWKMSWRERIRAFLTGVVWFRALGKTHPPILITAERPFE